MNTELKEIIGNQTLENIRNVVRWALLVLCYLIGLGYLLNQAVTTRPANRLLFEICFFVTALGMIVGFGYVFNQTNLFNNQKSPVKLITKVNYLVICLVSILIVQWIWWILIDHHLVPDPTSQKELLGMMSESKMIVVIYTVLIAPVIEELLFRGIFTNMFLKTKNKWLILVGVLVSSLLFGFLHTFSIGWNWIIYSSLGFILMISYIKTKDLKVPIILHVLNNIL